MKKSLLLSFCLLLMLPLVSFAQRNCGSMDHLQELQQQNPALIQKMERIENFTREYLANPPANLRAGELVTIPVVFHVIYKKTVENLSQAQLQSQLDVLNEDFRRTNADANNTWGQAADTEIEFCLATVDPNGNSTTGIQRRSTNKKSWQTNDQMKSAGGGGFDAWDASQYLNIWICNISGGILGYAQFPGGNPATDGIVLDYAYTGRGGSAQAPFNLGRTGTHEVGHWLNLRHIWGDGGCSVDDFVGDTPLSDAPNYGCANGHVSCSTVDMVQNYMDYSDDACMNLYTAGQRDRMQALFAAGGAKASFLNSGGCGASATPTCSDGIQNQGETGVDCGGPCAPCATATCSDGIQNQGETGVDCGGPCAPCSTSCDEPSNPSASNIKPKRAKLNWSAVSGATSYDARVRSAGSTNWSNFNTANTNITISGLSNNTTYEWEVRANCSSGASTYAGTCDFTAGNANSGACGNNKLNGSYGGVKLFPNPVNDYLNVELQLSTASTIQVKMLDMNGKVLQTQEIAGDISTIQMNVSDLSVGMYFLSIETKEGNRITKRFVVNRF